MGVLLDVLVTKVYMPLGCSIRELKRHFMGFVPGHISGVFSSLATPLQVEPNASNTIDHRVMHPPHSAGHRSPRCSGPIVSSHGTFGPLWRGPS